MKMFAFKLPDKLFVTRPDMLDEIRQNLHVDIRVGAQAILHSIVSSSLSEVNRLAGYLQP